MDHLVLGVLGVLALSVLVGDAIEQVRHKRKMDRIRKVLMRDHDGSSESEW